MNNGLNKKLILGSVLLFAVIVGVFAITPQLLIWKNISESGGKEIYLLKTLDSYNNNTRGFLPKVREVYDNGWPSMELSLDSNRLTIFPLIPIYLAAAFLKFFNGNTNITYLAISFVFTAATFLIVFWISRRMIKSGFLGALLIALTASLSPALLYLPKAFFKLSDLKNIILTSFYPGVKTLLSRPFLSTLENPLIVVPFFLLAVLALYIFWEKPNLSSTIFAGIACGLIFNVYFFNWVYLTIVIGFLFIYSVIKRKENPQRLKYFLILGLILFIFFLPFLSNYLKFSGSEASQYYPPRYAEIEYGRFFRWEMGHSRAGIPVYTDYIFYLLLAVAVFYTFRKTDRNKGGFYLCTIVAMFVAWNVQLVTGYVPESFHWTMVISPVIFIILADLAKIHLGRLLIRLHIKLLLIMLVILLLISSLVTKKVVNAVMFINPPEEFVKKQSFNSDIINSWRWINDYLPKNSKIVSNSFKTSIYFNNYTSAKPYLPFYITTLATTKEMERRFVYANKIFRIPEEIFIGRAKQDQEIYKTESEGVMNGIYGNIYRNIHYSRPGAPINFQNKPPEEKVNYLLQFYRSSNPTWQNIEADYVYNGPFEKELKGTANFAKDQTLLLIYKNHSVEIYKIKK